MLLTPPSSTGRTGARRAAFLVLTFALLVALLGGAPAWGAGAYDIHGGGDFFCATMDSGNVRCWGQGTDGQLGNGDDLDSPLPVTAIVSNPRDIALGGYHACAVLGSRGKVKCWGDNNSGQIGNGTESLPVLTPAKALNVRKAVEVSAGDEHSCALLQAGTVKCWGENSSGELGNGEILSTDEAVHVVQLSSATQISSGENSTCAVFGRHNAAKCWGLNNAGQLGDQTTGDSNVPVVVKGVRNILDLAPGYEQSCALLFSGIVKCWGDNSDGQLGNGSFNPSLTPVTVNGINNAWDLDSFGAHTCALVGKGTVKCWGDNSFGNLGNNDDTDSDVPIVTTPVIRNATAVSTAWDSVCVILTNGGAKCWGYNTHGEVGNGTTNPAGQWTPVDVSL